MTSHRSSFATRCRLTVLAVLLISTAAAAAPPETYLVGFAASFSPTFTQTLVFVDPANPATPALSLTDPTSPFVAALFGSTFVPPSTVTDQHFSGIVTRSEGRLFLTSLVKPGPPAPVQISSESNANSICGRAATTPELFVYVVAVNGSTCRTGGDREFRLVRFDMGPGDAPVVVPSVVTALRDAQQTVIGWLATEGQTLKRYDTAFGNGQNVTAFASAVTFVAGDTASGTVLLRIDNALRAYHTATGTLSGSLHDFVHAGPNDVRGQDAAFVYLRDTDQFDIGVTSRILRVPIDGSGAATTLATDVGAILDHAATAGRVVYLIRTASGDAIKSVPKTGGQPTVLETAGGPPAGLRLASVRATIVYYDKVPSAGPGSAVRVNEDGSGKVETPSALWGGSTFPVTCDIAVDGCLWPDKILRIDGVGVGSVAGATVRSLDAATAALVATLGVLPAGTIDFFAGGLGLGDRGTASVGIQSGSQVFYFDAATQDSLVQVAGNTPELILGASVNQTTVAVGQTLIGSVELNNPGLPGVSADFYVGLLAPNLTIEFATPTGTFVGSLTDPTSFRPIATGVPLDTAFGLTPLPVLTHARQNFDPTGDYFFIVLAVVAGALADGVVVPSDILGVSVAPASFP
jgi:hypothetical protein